MIGPDYRVIFGNVYPTGGDFRAQQVRSLEDVDKLVINREHLRMKLGAEKADEIEKDPDTFYNHEKYRIFQAKAMRRACIAAFVIPCAAVYAVTGGKNMNQFIRNNRALWYGAIVGSYAVTYKPIHMAMGF